MPVIKNNIYIEAPIDKVLQFKNDPVNMIQYRANASDYHNISGAGEVGTTCDLKILMLGIYIPFRLEVIEDSKIADKLIIEKMMTVTIAHTLDNLKIICEARDPGSWAFKEFIKDI